MDKASTLHPDEFKRWQDLYEQTLTIDGQESIVQADGTRRLVFLPMLIYTLVSTMLQKLKYLPNQCFNRVVIGDTPICGLRPIDRASPPMMTALTEILRIIVDGVRKEQINDITMIFYQKKNINTIYDSYSIVLDYSLQLPANESKTSVVMIVDLLHQIEYMFNWNDTFPNDVELTFVLSARDQFDQDEGRVPSPFGFVKQSVKEVKSSYETTQLLGRLITPHGKIWLKFLPHMRQLSGSSIRSEDLPTRANLLSSKRPAHTIESSDEPPPMMSPKLRKTTKSSESSPSVVHLPSLASSTSLKPKKKGGLLATVRSLITPSRTPAPVTSSTPNITPLVLIPHTSTPKPGETASRITIDGRGGVLPSLSAISESSTSNIHQSSPTPSTITTTDISTAQTPTINVERRSTVRGQAAMARKKIAAMQIRDDDEKDEDDEEEEDDDEQFQRLFSQGRSKKTKKNKTPALFSARTIDDRSDVSSVSSVGSNSESLFTPPTVRKRAMTDRGGVDDLATEHGTPPKTPRTARRNRITDERSPMDIDDLPVTIDSPRLLRSITKKLQQQASAKKQLVSGEQSHEEEEEEMDRVYVRLERSSIGLHYSMEESD